MNSGAHSLNFGGLYGGGRASGEVTTWPPVSRTNISSGCISSFGTPEGAMTMQSPTLIDIPPPGRTYASVPQKEQQTPQEPWSGTIQ